MVRINAQDDGGRIIAVERDKLQVVVRVDSRAHRADIQGQHALTDLQARGFDDLLIGQEQIALHLDAFHNQQRVARNPGSHHDQYQQDQRGRQPRPTSCV
ncbi:MAG TPA: hypothetical protein PKE04_23435 [Clostridia bacterium]|nr:hypothetical protein [Clostridia bacterium]